MRPVLPLIRFADRTRAIVDTGLELVGVLDDAFVPELESFDSIYSWYGTNRPEFRHAVKHLPFTFFPALPISPEGVPKIPVPDRAHRATSAVIHPFSGSPRKNWPLERYRELAGRLSETIPVRWCAGPEENSSKTRYIFIGDLYALGCWLSTASVCVHIGNDSGISHLAAAVGAPVVAIFISTDPRIWAPRGAQVAVLENPSVEDVVRAVGTRQARPIRLVPSPAAL